MILLLPKGGLLSMASGDQLRKIAIYCDEYTTKTNDHGSLVSSTGEKHESCTNCIHFSLDRLCELNLIDKVLSSLSMENDLKS